MVLINFQGRFMKIIKKNTENQLIESFIDEFLKKTNKLEKKAKKISFVLTGGESPIKLYNKLSVSKINWNNINFFWGDERFVSKNSIHSNYKLVKDNFLKFIKIKKNQIYYINTKKSNVEQSSLDYNKRILNYFKSKKISFDIILLGMGNDGHIASLFKDNINKNKNKITSSVIRNDFQRITLNIKTINKSKFIFLWLNTKKKATFFNLIRKKKIYKHVPVNYLNKKKLIIFLKS